MKAQLASPAGMKTLENMLAANKASIPGNNELDAVSLWAAWLQGKVAMIYSWPPTGRMSCELFAERQGDQLHSAIVDRRTRSAMPWCRGNPEHATGYNKALAADSANAEAAYLFMQWATVAAGVARARMLPYALRDPYRLVALQVGRSTVRSGPTREGVSASTYATRPTSACST